MKITGKIIEVGTLEDGSGIGICIERADAGFVTLHGLSEDEAREMVRHLFADVAITAAPDAQPVEPGFLSMTGSKAIDGAREYLVDFMMAHFNDKTFHRYILGRIGGSGPIAGDFAFEIARAIAITATPNPSPTALTARSDAAMDRQYLAGYDAGFMAGEAGDYARRTAVHEARSRAIREDAAPDVQDRAQAAYGYDHLTLCAQGQGFDSIASALCELARLRRPGAPSAPASDSADGFLPLPDGEALVRANGFLKKLYTTDQVHAAILADRAARQVFDTESSIVADIRDAVSKDRCDGESEWANGVNSAVRQHTMMIDAAIARRAARQVPATPVQLDPVVEANRVLLHERSQVGIKKYGVTLHEANYTRQQLMTHALEEVLDLANYLQADLQRAASEAPDLAGSKA